MKTILLVFLATGMVKAQDTLDYPAIDRRRDSMHIYSVYKDKKQELRTATNVTAWATYMQRAHMLTCAVIKQLSKYNKTPYLPNDSSIRQPFATAYSYPKPTEEPTLSIYASSHTNFIVPRVVIYDNQTRFTTKDNGRTALPYTTKEIYKYGKLSEREILLYKEKE